MRTPATIATLALVALCPLGLRAFANEPHHGARSHTTHDERGAQTSTASTNSDAGATQATTGADASAASTASSPDASGASTGARTYDLPMAQRGTGAMTYFPIPEQLTRNDAPVFAQVRTSAPLDHVALFYRGHGGRRFTEVRMNPMGAEQGMVGGYGALIPCEDTFPPGVEYYVVAMDTSGSPVGSAGSEAEPLNLPIVNHRNYPIVPTLPGQPAPRNCGALVTANPNPHGGSATHTAANGDGGTTSGPANSSGTESSAGSADLGEPCARTEDCHTGLRCGTTHRCVFPARR